MWPYGKKTVFNNGKPSLQLTGSNASGYFINTQKPVQSLNNEYYKRLTMSVSLGVETYPVHKVDHDGRVLRQHGVSSADVTNQYLSQKYLGQRTAREAPARQLHNRNVSQLRVVLSMSDDQRKEPLSQITGPIMRNEVAPPISQIQKDEFLGEHLKKQTSTSLRLPPLRRRMSLNKAKQIETVAKVVNAKRNDENRSSNFIFEQEDSEDEDSLPYIGRQGSAMTSDHFSDLPPPNANWVNGIYKRRQSFSHRYRLKPANSDDSSEGKTKRYEEGLAKGYNDNSRRSSVAKIGRKDSVGMLTESIRDQFRAALRQDPNKAVENKSAQNTDGTSLLLSSSAIDSAIKQIPREGQKTSTGGYKLRHEYGKNIEKNWFMNHYMKKQTGNKNKTNEQNMPSTGYDLRLDIFYSPEPQSDEELEGEFEAGDDAMFAEGDDASMQCGAFSTMTGERRARANRKNRPSLRNQTSLEPHLEEEDAGSDGVDSSGSDIEIILKDNQLIQRKTKHKLRKKRQRQLERYRAFMPQETGTVNQKIKTPDAAVPLTDQEIRALRLNLRNKDKGNNLKGKRKFKQIVNVVYASVIFKNILTNIRKRKKMIIKSREKKIAQMVAKRLKAQQKQMEKEEDTDERNETPKPALREMFMQEMGLKLIYDVGRLNISESDESEFEEEAEDGQPKEGEERKSENRRENNMEERRENNKEVRKENNKEIRKESNNDARKESNRTAYEEIKITRESKFAKELKKVSLKDLNKMDEPKKKKMRRKHKTRRRRHSIPVSIKPTEFLVEVPEKSRRRRDRASVSKPKEVKRFKSPPVPSCSCLRHKRLTESRPSSHIQMNSKCSHQPEAKRRKVKTIKVETAGLMRTYSLENLTNKRPIELEDLLKGIDFPAKDIKLQILRRKFIRQRRKQQQIRLSPVQMIDRPPSEQEGGSDCGSDSAGSDTSDESDYDFVYGGPFVGSGVMWNQTSSGRKPTWTDADVDREVQRITRIFHEMKECRYLRLDGFNDAIVDRLNNINKNSMKR